MKLPPIAVACLSALAIDSCSNVIAQRLKAWNESKPFVFDRVLFTQFAIMVVIMAPVNFHWQNWLERAFPGWKTERRTRVVGQGEEEKGIMLKEDEERMGVVEEEVRVRDWWNVFRKWFTDCITMGALLNQSAFLVLIGLMKGKTVPLIVQDFRNELFGLIFDSYKVWPIANFFSTTYVPVERRIIFLSFCGLLWNIYLSLVAARL
ncbi:integral membrane protein-like protein [Decorospora gaudefroyi]|uniref:Integral membrane protein-like protein n=1 Tax=Decorospora gaudefroyi TaxID=184978 RepID=A0A6A5KHD2_9PLEO|nr:integral membrane protein-like protein [Decorospora gaudefroyi]